MLRIHEIKRGIGQATDVLPQKIEKRIGLPAGSIVNWRLVKESVDARDKSQVMLVNSVDFDVKGVTEDQVLQRALKKKLKIGKAPDERYIPVMDRPDYAAPKKKLTPRPVVVGFGPCGMFCALTLAQMGYEPIVLERGRFVEQRAKDVETFWKEADKLWPQGRPAPSDLKRLVTLASIVEKETSVPEERARVAGVYSNRLRIRMLLQADPTVMYGMGPDFKGRLLFKHLEDEKNLYNTYRRPGLPPGPICSFGSAALKAALEPEPHKFLYFVATGKGREHKFSRTLSEHNRAVQEYRAAMRQKSR